MGLNRKLILRLLGFIVLCLWGSLQVQAQIGKERVESKSAKDSLEIPVKVPDTISVTYYFQGAENQVFIYADTSLSEYFHQYDAIRRHPFEGLNLGNMGSPSRALMVDAIRPMGLDWGFHQFDAYTYSVDSLPFFGLGRALTDTYFSFKGQTNSVFRAQFSRQFQDGFQFSLKYSKINQLGQFLSQKAVLSSLATGVQYLHPKGRYRFYLTMSSNNTRMSDNGGLPTDSLFFTTGFNLSETQPIYLTDAQTHQLKRRYQFFQFYKIGHFRKGNYLELRHKSWAEKGFYKFFDNKAPLDSTYYGPFLTDGRGIRQYFSGSEVGTEVALSFMGRTQDSLAFQWLPTPGISVVKYKVNQEPISFEQTQLSLTGDWEVTLKKIFHLSAKANLGLVGNTGDYLLNGQLGIETGKIGSWVLLADLQSVTPSMLAQKSYVTQNEIWSNDFQKEFINRVGANYKLAKYHLALGGRFTLLTNHIYFDTDGFPAQESKTIPILQLTANKNIKVRGFQLNTNLLYQKVGDNLIRRPAFYAHEQLFWLGDVFKQALRLKVGVDYRFYSSWKPDAYFPVVGQFGHQEEFTMGNLSGFDVFADFKVSTFRFFAKMENLQYNWDQRVFYQTHKYPQFKPMFRMGIGWIFRD